MTDESSDKPWETLESLVEQEDRDKLGEYLDDLAAGDAARALDRLSTEERSKVVALLEPESAAELLQTLPEVTAAEVIDEMPAEQAAAIVHELRSDAQADLLANVPTDEAEAILEEMDQREAAQVRKLREYPPDSAGGLMITEYLAYPEDLQIGDVIDDLREHGEEYADYDVQYAYVTSDQGTLVGVLRLRDLLLKSRGTAIKTLMIDKPLCQAVSTTLPELEQFFHRHRLVGVPVVDEEERLVGVVRGYSVEHATSQRSEKALLHFAGIIRGEELRSMPLTIRCGRRLSWLSLNIVLNVAAASVIAVYQDTLSAVIALAVFLPIISDMSGCAGNQAVAVSMRELVLGVVKAHELARVFGKELLAGLLNGMVLGTLLGILAYLWKGNPYLGLVAGVALAANTIVSVCIGGCVPLLVRRLGLDPALVSGPILTTITDMCGFFLVLSLASAMLPLLITGG